MAWSEEMRAKARETKARKDAEREAAAEAEAAPTMAAVMSEDSPVPLALGVADEPEAELVEVAAMDPFERFLAAQDPETRSLLTDIELRVIFEEETKRALDAKKAAQRKAGRRVRRSMPAPMPGSSRRETSTRCGCASGTRKRSGSPPNCRNPEIPAG